RGRRRTGRETLQADRNPQRARRRAERLRQFRGLGRADAAAQRIGLGESASSGTLGGGAWRRGFSLGGRGRPATGLGCWRRRRYQRTIMRDLIRILGIDPGLRRTGWGVVALDGNRLSFLACGSLATDEKAGLAARLLAIHDGLRRVVEQHAPHE